MRVLCPREPVNTAMSNKSNCVIFFFLARRTPLHCAASCNNVQVCKFLVESGAAVFAMTYSDMQTAADKCEEMEEGYTQCSQFLYGMLMTAEYWSLSGTWHLLVCFWMRSGKLHILGLCTYA